MQQRESVARAAKAAMILVAPATAGAVPMMRAPSVTFWLVEGDNDCVTVTEADIDSVAVAEPDDDPLALLDALPLPVGVTVLARLTLGDTLRVLDGVLAIVCVGLTLAETVEEAVLEDVMDSDAEPVLVSDSEPVPLRVELRVACSDLVWVSDTDAATLLLTERVPDFVRVRVTVPESLGDMDAVALEEYDEVGEAVLDLLLDTDFEDERVDVGEAVLVRVLDRERVPDLVAVSDSL
jgi:hypothetical protein